MKRYMGICFSGSNPSGAVFFSTLQAAAEWSRTEDQFFVLRRFRQRYVQLTDAEDEKLWKIHNAEPPRK